MIKIAVVLPTKDRHGLLHKCLESLVDQGQYLKEVIIVDSSKDKESKKTVTKFKGQLKIKYIYQKPNGYPAAYNKGIKKTQGRWIAFLNDDCTVSSDWAKGLSVAIDKYPTHIIQGKSISVPTDNIYAAIMGDHYKNWVRSHQIYANLLDTFDSKCSVIPRDLFYKKGKFKGFDERLVRGSEDIEMGQRFIAEGKKVIYVPEIIIYHTERTTLGGFVKQHLRIARAEANLTEITKYGNVPMFPKKKTLLNLKSLINRELRYLKKLEIVNAIYLPFLYFLLFAIRALGYSFKR